LLDGEVARLSLLSELGFSKSYHGLNIRHAGFVVNEMTKK